MIEKRDFNRLIKSASKGDAGAFARLFDRYYDAVFVYVNHHIGNKSEAEEITSGVFLAALENMGSFGRSGQGFGTWLFQIARSDINDFKKKRGSLQEDAAEDVSREEAAEEVSLEAAAESLKETTPAAAKAGLEEDAAAGAAAEEITREAPAEGKALTRNVLLAHAGSLVEERKQIRRGAAGSGRGPEKEGRKGGLLRAVPLRSRRLLAPLAIAAALLLFTGTAWAASGASPDSPLYPLKIRFEDMRTFLAMQGLDRAASKTERAGKRLDEMLEMVDRGRPGHVPRLLSRCDSLIDNASNLVDESGYGSSESFAVAGMIEGTLERRRSVLLEISGRLPDDIRAELADELLALEEGRDSKLAVTVATAPTEAAPATAPAADAATGSCQYAEYYTGYSAGFGSGFQCYCVDSSGVVYMVAATDPAAAAGAASVAAGGAAGAASGAAAADPASDPVVKPDPLPPVNTGRDGDDDDDDEGYATRTTRSKKHKD